ncbi:MAG: DNA polymerase III subunit alpha, partial [Saprospiraceae bacterium]|nr:DNA polymerase III subunit alpha [Saprospiraceae bacterium]
MPDFIHLHCHTQYSLLDGASSISKMMEKAVKDDMKAVALTDHGNMFGAFKFVAEAEKNKLKPIVGCEFYLVEDRHKKAFSNAKGEKDRRFHQLLLAKNKQGYENLSKLCSLGFIEGMYSKYPRIDKELLLQYHEGLIATSCCIGAEIPQAILERDLEKAENLIKWWIDLMGDDFYIELQRHSGMEDIDGKGISQEDVNQQLLLFAEKYNLKVIATNDSHYVEEEDSAPHDILLCVNTGSKINDAGRFAFPSNDFYFKTKNEMALRFADLPAALENTIEIYDKIETIKLKRDILLPNFPLPPGFKTQADYLRHLVYEGAKSRYNELNALVTERLEHELKIISGMGFEGYFLVVQDFIKAARKLGVAVGPGRGSAAGSAVAYCLTITNIDPIKYRLLFERFLNPERISMPDIDIDFDDYGRQQVIDYVVDKYGKDQVAQIITFGTMAAKSSIRDVARVLDLPLSDSDRIAKYVPTKPNTKFKDIINKSSKELSENFGGDDVSNILKLNEILAKDDLEGRTMKMATKLEGSVRNSGIHAAGIIIAPDDIKKYIPVCVSKESDLLVTQFDGSVVESAGMLKMDFLGLKTLSIIR